MIQPQRSYSSCKESSASRQTPDHVTEKANDGNEVSQKMRLFCRVLQVEQKITLSELSLDELLKPGHFYILTQCARNISGFEEYDGSLSKKCFKASGISIHSWYELERAAVIVHSPIIYLKSESTLREKRKILLLRNRKRVSRGHSFLLIMFKQEAR